MRSQRRRAAATSGGETAADGGCCAARPTKQTTTRHAPSGHGQHRFESRMALSLAGSIAAGSLLQPDGPGESARVSWPRTARPRMPGNGLERRLRAVTPMTSVLVFVVGFRDPCHGRWSGRSSAEMTGRSRPKGSGPKRRDMGGADPDPPRGGTRRRSHVSRRLSRAGDAGARPGCGDLAWSSTARRVRSSSRSCRWRPSRRRRVSPSSCRSSCSTRPPRSGVARR